MAAACVAGPACAYEFRLQFTPVAGARGLVVTGYAFKLGKVAGDPRLIAVGRKHGKSAVQVTLRWLIQREDVIAIPKTSKPERLKENLDVFDFRLTDAEMDQISHMSVPNSRLINEPLWVPRWD